jgi:phosphatidate cytidylyltransferase
LLKQRVLTALAIGIVALITVFALPTWAMALVLAAVLLVGAWEWSGFAKWPPPGRAAYVVVMALAILLVVPLSDAAPPAIVWVMSAAAAWWLLALIWLFRFPTPIPTWVIALAGLCVILPAWLALTYLHGQAPLGRFLVFLVLVTVWAADVGAFFVGRQLGRIKLAPQVSPGKTWEGVAGGLVAAAAAALVLCLMIDADWRVLLLPVLVAALISVVGDLTVSMFKRNAGLKDSGRLFPGHGGVMDRLDSLAAAAPVFVLVLAISPVGH